MKTLDQPIDTKKLKPNLILAICCSSLLMVSMDATIVNVGLPSIRREFDASIASLQWIIDAYTMVVASLLMLAGSMADRYGRRRIFQLGMGIFMLGSLWCSIAHGIDSLVMARVLQALGATMLNPVAMSIITNTFVEPKERARAIGIWGAIAGVSMALGPIIGGALTQSVGWRSMFWINIPIGTIAMIMAAIYIPESKAARSRRVDPVGQILVFAALACLVSGVIEGPRVGWSSPQIIAAFCTALASLVGLIFYEAKRFEPLIDLRFFKSFPFASATIIAISAFAGFSGFLFLNTLYLQEIRHLSAFNTGLCTLPLALSTIVFAPISGKLVGNYGTRLPLLLSGLAVSLSAFILTGLTDTTPIPLMFVAYVTFGLGFGLVNAPVTNTAVSGMPKAQAGVAAAIASTSRQVGAALGVAIAGTIGGSHSNIGANFSQATHMVWWLIVGAGAIISSLGWLSNTAWAKKTTENAAHLLAEDNAGNLTAILK